jgi:hypothetical protein
MTHGWLFSAPAWSADGVFEFTATNADYVPLTLDVPLGDFTLFYDKLSANPGEELQFTVMLDGGREDYPETLTLDVREDDGITVVAPSWSAD